MIKKDELYRKQLNENIVKPSAPQGTSPPTTIQIPSSTLTSWQDGGNVPVTPRANGNYFPMTPSMGIGIATPTPVNLLPGVPENASPLDKRTSQVSRTSVDKPGDYFSSAPDATTSDSAPKLPVAPSDVQDERRPKSSSDVEKDANGKESGTFLGKKFRMGIPFGSKKLGRSASTAAEKPVVVDEKSEGSETSEVNEKEVDDSFHGIIQRIHMEYEKNLLDRPGESLESGITPSLPSETPVLKPPKMTTVIIQQETSGGSADLYRGAVGTVGEDASLVEEHAPMWLGDLLLRVSYAIYIVYCADSSTEQNPS
jgi:WD repeat-containing protein 48